MSLPGKNADITVIYNYYVDDMYTYAMYLGFNEYDIMDAIHDVFCNLCYRQKKLNEISNLKFYLFKSLKNRLIDISRNKKDKMDFNSLAAREFLNSGHKNDTENRLIQKEDEEKIQNTIREILALLSPRQQEIIYLRYIQEYNYEQIAELMDINYENSRKLVYKAILSLRRKLPGKNPSLLLRRTSAYPAYKRKMLDGEFIVIFYMYIYRNKLRKRVQVADAEPENRGPTICMKQENEEINKYQLYVFPSRHVGDKRQRTRNRLFHTQNISRIRNDVIRTSGK